MIKQEETRDFYGDLAPFYHLIYSDWDEGIHRQAGDLDRLIRGTWGSMSTILDVSCGIGTQALGLAELGYRVTASDLSPKAVERAQQEAASRNLFISFSTADMRRAHDHHGSGFDLVLSADNSVPHLLTDDDILHAFQQFHACTRPGGGCLITVRDYETEDSSRPQVKLYGMREENGVRWLIWQVWDPRPPHYDVSMYFAEDRGTTDCITHSMRSTYYAVPIPRLMQLMVQAGFSDVRRLDNVFFQPVIIGTAGDS